MSIKIMNLVWESQFDSHSKKLVLLALADNANDDGYCWPSISTIAKKASVSERWVSTCLAQLQKDGWLSITKKYGRQNYYKVNSTPEPTSPLNSLHYEPSSRGTPEPSSSTPLNPLQVTPEPTSPKPPRTIIKPPIKPPMIKFDLPDIIPSQDWDDFRDMRRSMKKPLSQRAGEILIKKLTDWFAAGHNPSEILQNSIANNWQGLFEPKTKGENHATNRPRVESFAERSARKQDDGIRAAAENLARKYSQGYVIAEGFGDYKAIE